MTYPPHRFGRLGLAFARLFGGRVHRGAHTGVRVRGMVRCRPGGPVFIGLGIISTLVAGVLVLATLLAGRLTQGPITLDMLKAPMAQALEQRVGSGYKFDIGDVLIEKGPYGFGLIIQSLSVKNAKGHVLLAAPKALVGIDMFALLVGEVKPTRLDLAGLEVRVSVDANGAIALSAGTDTAKPITLAVPTGPAAPAVRTGALASATAPMRGLAAAIAATVDLATYEKSPLGALVHLGIADGRLVIEDRSADRTIVFSNFDLGFQKDAPGEATLTVAANGPNGRWSANARAAETGDRGRVLDVQFKDLSLAEFMLAGGVRKLPFATVMPVSGRAIVDITSDGVLRGAKGDFSLGAGVLHIDDPDQKPFQIDEVTGRFQLDPAKGRIDIEKAQYFAQETHVNLHGAIGIPETADAPWTIALTGDTVIVPARTADPSLKAKVDVAAAWDPRASKLTVTRMQLVGPDIDAWLDADFRVAPDSGPHLKVRIGLDRPLPVGHAGSLWPTYVQPKLRKWVLEHVLAGRFQSGGLTFDCDAACFIAHDHKQPMPVDALDLDAAVSGVEIGGIDGMPRLSGVDGSGKVRAQSASFSGSTVDLADPGGGKLTLTDWTFEMPNTVPAAMPVTGSARLEGSIASLREFVRSGTLSKHVTVPPELDAARGKVDARVGVDFTINGDDAPAFRAKARVTNFAVDKVVGDEKIENCTLNVSLDEEGVRAKGEGKIFGAPATLELRKPIEGPGEATMQATLDDAFRLRRGLTLGSKLTGPVIVRATTPLGREKGKTQVEADFTRAKIDNLLPGWTKAAGRPAKATLTIARRQDYVALEQISLESGGATIHGNAEFSPTSGLISAKLTQLRIGTGDDMRVDVSRSSEGMRIAIRAGTMDARPLLRGMAAGTGGGAAKNGMSDGLEGKSIDLDLKAQTVTGQNQRVMKNVDLKLTRKGSTVSQLRFSAKVGRGTLAARLDPGATPLLTITAGDAGAALAFFDFYKHMEAGQLEASIQMGADNSQAGSASIDQFVLRDEPAISRVSAQAQQEGAAGSINLNPALVHFTRFQTVFNRGGGKVTLRDTVMWGSEIGATVEGTVDFARDYVNLHGTFVPAYALNNMFSKIPFFGPLLGGGSNEGLFAVNYRVSGAASSPTVSINLLTAIAPGFLRQIFGAIDGSNASTGYRAPDASAYAPASRPLAFPSNEN